MFGIGLEEAVWMFLVGFLMLGTFNLILEIIGSSILGGDRAPNVAVRLIGVVVLSMGVGYAALTYSPLRDLSQFGMSSSGSSWDLYEDDAYELDDFDSGDDYGSDYDSDYGRYADDDGPMCEPDYYWVSCEGEGCTGSKMCRDGCAGEWVDEDLCPTDDAVGDDSVE